jgi:hypothetical protein
MQSEGFNKIILPLPSDASPDLPALALVSYIQSLLLSPLITIETLLQVQYQPTADTEEYYNVDQSNTAPLYIPRLQGDLTDTVRKITASEEGFWCILKGHLTHFTFKSLFGLIQPNLEEGVNDLLNVFEDVNPWTHVLSVAATGVLLSPLELVRTRLIVQSSSSKRRRFS